jgi:hypothetical protein
MHHGNSLTGGQHQAQFAFRFAEARYETFSPGFIRAIGRGQREPIVGDRQTGNKSNCYFELKANTFWE